MYSKMELTHISLFTGIAGIDFAAEWAGFRTILFMEIDKYCQKVLKKHWPDVPIIGDIRNVTKETIANATSQRLQNKTNKQEMEGKGGSELQSEQPGDTKVMAFTQGSRQYPKRQTLRAGEKCPKPRSSNQYEGRRTRSNNTIPPVTLITGGFPCQPVSSAGQRSGKEDDRWLWPEMLRVISEVRPTWVVAENVAGLLRLGFNDCVSDLEGKDYETIPFLIPACSVNAPHRRDRIFIVAHYKGGRLGQELSSIPSKILSEDKPPQEPESSGGNGANTEGKGLEGADTERAALSWRCPTEYIGSNWWAVEPDVGRVAHGIPSRVDRLKCLGNAVVPQQIYPILKAIADIEIAIHNTPKC